MYANEVQIIAKTWRAVQKVSRGRSRETAVFDQLASLFLGLLHE